MEDEYNMLKGGGDGIPDETRDRDEARMLQRLRRAPLGVGQSRVFVVGARHYKVTNDGKGAFLFMVLGKGRRASGRNTRAFVS